jgi:hypothetical protein
LHKSLSSYDAQATVIDPQLSAQIVALPCWSGAITVEPLIGGMTNSNYLVADSSGARYVLRVGRDLTEHGVLRFNELAAARAAHAAGISPEVVYAREGLLVSRYVDGRTLEAADVREAGQLLRIVELLRDCHERIPRHLRGPALMFWVFQVIRNYVLLLGEPGANPSGWTWNRWLPAQCGSKSGRPGPSCSATTTCSRQTSSTMAHAFG